jgi:hypothetical protein
MDAQASTSTLTTFLATWGAVLSTFGLGWTFYRDLHDRARLKLTAHVRRVVQSANGQWYAVKPDLAVVGASAQLFIVMDVTNVGRRPVHWIGWGGKYHTPVDGKDGFSVIPHALPKKLGEGDWHSEYTDELKPAEENVKQLFIWDASGKHWNLSRRALRELKAESLKFQG